VVTTEPNHEKQQLKILVLSSVSPVYIVTYLAKQVKNIGRQQPHTLAGGEHMSAICRKMGSFFSFIVP